MPFLDLPYTVTICGLAELRQFSASGITHVISILDPSWPEPQDFSRYPPHQRTLFRFHDTILDDPAMLPPGEDDIANLLALGKMAAWSRIDHLLIHCHMGVSRSTAAASILLAENAPGQEDAVFDHLFEIRPRSWPNSRMVGIADVLLHRNGALVDAMRRHHARVAHRFPDFAAELRLGERAEEVP